MRSITLLLLALVISLHAKAGKKLNVLFIGNSYTYVNNLPQITADIAHAMGDTLIFDSYTVGGYSFWDHLFDPLCAKKIRSAQWDYVVLQEQSMEPSQPTNDFFSDSYYLAAQLDTMIQSNDPCTKTMFYMTWGYKYGDTFTYKRYPSWTAGSTYEGMDSLTRLRYRMYADTALLSKMGYSISGSSLIRCSQVSPIGAVRHYIRHNYSTIELYQSDGSHPTEAGSYASACTFYVALFHNDPALITYNYTLGTTDAANIRTAAKIVAYDSMSYWHIGQYDLRAQFKYTAGSGNTVSFTNISTNATTYTWYFGDGSTSTTASPSHTYASGGIYLAKLIAANAGCSDTTYMAVSTYPSGIEYTNNPVDFSVFPNPVYNRLNISSEKFLSGTYHIYIHNSIGQLVYTGESISGKDQVIDISGFNNGIYLISIVNNGTIIYQNKIAK